MLVFFNDILIYNKSWDEHVEDVDMILKTSKKQLYENPSKCNFGVQEVEYLVHIISHRDDKLYLNKLKSIMNGQFQKY
jgi:hypothetical protein